MTATDAELQEAADDQRTITRRRRLHAQLRALELETTAAIRRQHKRGISMAQLARDSGLSILIVRMICRPEVREAHNERRRKPTTKAGDL